MQCTYAAVTILGRYVQKEYTFMLSQKTSVFNVDPVFCRRRSYASYLVCRRTRAAKNDSNRRRNDRDEFVIIRRSNIFLACRSKITRRGRIGRWRNDQGLVQGEWHSFIYHRLCISEGINFFWFWNTILSKTNEAGRLYVDMWLKSTKPAYQRHIRSLVVVVE